MGTWRAIMKDKNIINAECRVLEKVGKVLLNNPVSVRPITDGEEIGYTDFERQKPYVYISFVHKMLKPLSETEQIIFRKGVAAHEFLHCLLTNFAETNRRLNKIGSKNKRQLLMTYFNIVEDPAIEHFAPTQFSGLLLKALYFSINHIYKNSEEITKAPDALTQYLNAMIQFGDLGIIKGEFTFPEAKKAFTETVEMFYDAICEPVGAKRLKMAEKIFYKTSYLWEDAIEMADFLSELSQNIIQKGSSAINGSSRGNTPNSDCDNENADGINKNQKSTILKFNPDTGKNGKSGSNGDDNGNDASQSKEDKKQNGNGGNSDKEDENSSQSKNGEEQNNNDGDGEKTPKLAKGAKTNNKKDENSTESEIAKGKNKHKNAEIGEGDIESGNSSSNNDNFSKDGEPSSNPESYGDGELEDGNEIWVLDVDGLINEIKEKVKGDIDCEVERIKTEELADVNDDPVESCDDISNIGSVENVVYTPSESDGEIYNSIVSTLEPSIKRVVHSIKSLLALDYVKVRPHNTGKLKPKNIYQVNEYISRKGRITENIFDKRILPKDKANMAVAIAVDLSGSMGTSTKDGRTYRYEAARECAISLAEIFSRLNIPIYIMGFDADTEKYDTRHHHFVRWKNTPSERKTLARIAALNDNRDGPSIRYLTKILSKKDAKHKLLVVISDGQPAAYKYPNGIADTKRAVEEAKAKFPVLGVSIGADEEKLKSFYGNDFIMANGGDDLLFGIVNKLKKLLK